MKRLIFILPMLLLLVACGSGSKGSSDESGVRALQANEPAAGEISKVGDVDWYTYQVTAPDTLLQIFCNSETLRPDVDLLMSVYEEDADGNKVRLFGTHAAEGAAVPAELQINLFVGEPKEIFIAVRDLKDDEAAKDETYYVRVTEAEAADGNETFAQADQLVIDDETSCKEDNIGDVGDTDCYTFDVAQEGIYVAKVDFNRFNGGTAVNLAVELYDDEGNELARLTQGQGEQYYLQHHLDVGTYYLLVEDQGQDDSDAASTFNVCVESLEVGEVGLNDTRDSAQTLTATTPGVYEIEGSLDYDGDSDWYLLPVGATTTSGLKILQLSFDDGSEPIMFNYQVGIEDGSSPGTSLLSHTYAGGSSAYLTQVKAGNGDHYLHIQAAPGQNSNQSAPYTATVTVIDVDDPAETAGDGNDSVTAADALTSGNTATGKVSYRGDEDWFSIQVDLSTPKVLSVDLSTAPGVGDEPHVEYYLSVMRDSVLKKRFDESGEDGATHLKTSLLVPQDTGTATYLFKVCDYQGNEGDTFDYNLLVTVSEIPATVPAGPAAADYFDEISEAASGTAAEVELENTSLDQPHFQADTGRFDFSAATQTTNADGTTTLEFPWVAGYVDYQGDQDWFKMPLDALDSNDDDWYYDVDVEVVQAVASGESDVEYVWKLYRDPNDNAVLVDRPTATDGYVGAVGDTDPTLTTPYSVNTATMDEDLWIGDGWGAGDYYLSMSDFNYVRIDNGDGSSIANSEPDDDWSNTAAYYFKVTLVYHPGVSSPE
jgi:hypothetical protein